MRRGVCKNILYDNAMQLVEGNNIKVIDVREKNEIDRNTTILGSINIPVNELALRMKEIVPDKSQPILVYCATGSRSIFACQILADMGYNKVYNLQGGIG